MQTVKLTVVFAVVLFCRVPRQFGVTDVIFGSIMNAQSLQKLSINGCFVGPGRMPRSS